MRVLSAIAGFLAAVTALTDGTAAPREDTTIENTVEVRQTLQCGTPGYCRSGRPYRSAKAINTAKACGEKCWSEVRCKSYSFGQGTCSLFDLELARSNFVRGYSPISFYERSCAAPPPPTRPEQSCKLTGYDNANAQTRFFTKSACNLLDCQALCKRRSRCQSYRHGQGVCVLFTAPVSKSFTADKASPFTFYDRECQLVASARPTGTSSSRLTTTTKSSSGLGTSSASTSVANTSTSTASTTDNRSSTTSSSTGSSTTAQITTASTTTSGAQTQETTFENVRISFKSAANRKRQDGSVNLPDGYISRSFNAKGQRVFTTDANDALNVKITVPKGGAITQTRLNLLTENSAAQTDLPALALIRSTSSAQAAQLFLGAALAGAPPADGSTNSLSRADSKGSYTAQSAIWTVNLQTYAVSAQWINADGTTTTLNLLSQDGVLFMASDISAFPKATQLTTTAAFADPAATCITINNYEYVNGQCLQKCPTGFQRVPGTISCAVPITTTCPAGQRAAAGLCVCTDTTKQLFNGTCIPRCDTSLKEALNRTTGQCGCRGDMARDISTNVCQCPTGQQDNGLSCECSGTGQVLSAGTCVCQSLTAVLINGACVENSGPRNFTNVLLSFTRSTAAKSKRQASNSQVDVSYGYISADLRATGERYLTNDQSNSLSVSFTVPEGKTTGQRLNLVGPASSSPAGIPTLSLLFDRSTLQKGVPFNSSTAHRMFLGSSYQTDPGSRPSFTYAIISSMDDNHVPANPGKFFAGETAVWTVDTTTGALDAYWIDGDRISTHMIPMSNGTDLFFAPEAVANQIDAMLLDFHAEIPGTPSPGRG